MTVILILGLWILGVCCHEFGHAIVAYWGGDHTVKDKGYLTFNPLRYTHPVFSLAFPLIIFLMGGIALPGGAVYIDHSRLKSSAWDSWVSLAGPIGSLLFGVMLALPFLLGFAGQMPVDIQEALAFLVMTTMAAVIINLLPVPGLDGFGVIRPYLPYSVQDSLRQLGNMTYMIIFLVVMNGPVGAFVFSKAMQLCELLNVPGGMAIQGYLAFRSTLGGR